MERNFGNDRVSFFLTAKLLDSFWHPTREFLLFLFRVPEGLRAGSRGQTVFTSGNEFGKSSGSKNALI